MARKKGNRWVGILLGPALTFMALVGLWKNETRFDFHRAAARTHHVASIDEAQSDELISFTGPMDQNLNISGNYVESFKGYLLVKRSAEIYAWDKRKSDNRTKWDLRWSSSVDSNERNRGITQQLSSARLLPAEYEVADLKVKTDLIEFVDSTETISPYDLTVTHPTLKPEQDFLYLHKGNSSGLGDERISYSGIPVPATATYFGKFDGQTRRGIADTSNQRTGMVNQIIMDTGVLHHVVAGDRVTALATMKAYFGRLKWIVRGIGTAGVILGLFILFATFVGFLFHIPVIGRIAEAGSFLLAVAIGLPLALVTIVASYLVANPLVLILIIFAAAGAMYFLRRRGQASQEAFQRDLDRRYGHRLEVDELKEQEFLELAQLALADSNFLEEEQAFLKTWANKHGWDHAQYEQLLAKAKQYSGSAEKGVSNDEHLMNLIRLAMADGTVSHYELKSIRTVARKIGYDDATIRELTQRVRQSVMDAGQSA